jgi:5-methylcytosine-specific restriction endonuclease McrA
MNNWIKNNTAEKRRRDQRIYKDPLYLRNRQIVLARAGGRCEKCGRRTSHLEVDHIVSVASSLAAGHDPDHSVANLRVLCAGRGSCHARVTAQGSHAARQRRASGQGDPEFVPHTRWTRQS